MRALKVIAICLYFAATCLTAGSLNAGLSEHHECDQSSSDYCADVRLTLLGQELFHFIQGVAWPLYWSLHLSTRAFQ